MVIAVDFDGTCVSHEFPKIGKEIGAVPVLKYLVEHGHEIILYTMRSDKPHATLLSDAIEWFNSHNIPLKGVNNNPTQHRWTDSPKIFANLYIDDANLGTPLHIAKGSARPYVNWCGVVSHLYMMNIIPLSDVTSLISQVQDTKFNETMGES